MRHVLLAIVLFAAPRALGETVEIKIATLAPPGSAWAKLMDKSSREVFDKTQGRVKFKYYYGGQQGDDRDVVRKMKLGQIDGGALTAVGIGLIKGDVRVMELPYLFRSYDEIDYVRGKLQPDFEKLFEEAGYVVLSWGDVGWVHYYARIPIRSKADLQKSKVWIWPDDPIARAVQKRLGIGGVPLGVPEVLSALQTGQIDACYGPPLAAVALQWYTKVKYATARPSAYATGALVVRKETWDKLKPEDQAYIRERQKETRDQVIAMIRRDNERAKQAMIKLGIQFLEPPPGVEKEFEEVGNAVWNDLAGQLYSKELLDKVKKHLAELRAQKGH